MNALTELTTLLIRTCRENLDSLGLDASPCDKTPHGSTTPLAIVKHAKSGAPIDAVNARHLGFWLDAYRHGMRHNDPAVKPAPVKVPSTLRSMTVAYTEGYDAHGRGAAPYQCPYKLDTKERRAWRLGYNDGGKNNEL